ncbi:MAG: YvcK family protein [bacterium]|jgi:uncharacterized cofD-like protein|nr:YvcK family protein [bacterium]MDD4558782.1 YvcK family protein [bacterium]
MKKSIEERMHLLKWLYPGMRVKRWLVLVICGVVLIGTGLALVINGRILGVVEDLLKHLSRISTGRILPPVANGLFLVGTGIAVSIWGTARIFRSIFVACQPIGNGQLVDIIYRNRQLEQGLRVVAFGGGTGLASLLRGLKDYTSNITAVVTVSDDGGSSGILRRETGIVPPGDIRNCLVALADAEPLMTRLFQHRFNGLPGLEGHAFGNLLLSALTDVAGDFEVAVKEASRVLAVRGRVFPSTLEDVVLWGEMNDGSLICGESHITASNQNIRRVYLKPDNCKPAPEVMEAIEEADAIVVGPGSLYTSVIPNLLISGVADAVREAEAVKIYVCNVMTQPGETDRYTAGDHLKALIDHAGSVVDYMLINNARPSEEALRKYREEGAELVRAIPEEIVRLGVQPIMRHLINRNVLVRHSPRRLGEAIYAVMEAVIQ